MQKKTLKEQLMEQFPDLKESDFSSYCSDLLILIDKRYDVQEWIQYNYKWIKNCKVFRSNVPGQDWYGKLVMEVPFACPDYNKTIIK